MAYLDLNSWLRTAAEGGNCREAGHVGGSEGIVPQKILTFFDALRCILVHSSASFTASMAVQCLPDYYLGFKSECDIYMSR